jgi:type II secretion system protein L
MSAPLDIFLHAGAATLGRQGAHGYQLQALPHDGTSLAPALAELQGSHGLAGADVTLYLGDDLLFFTTLTLPPQTPEISKAIALQLEMLSPFGEDSLVAFTARRGKEGSRVNLYCCRRSLLIPILEMLLTAGARLTGLYPESQRYLTRATQKLEWLLWSPGRFGRLTHFRQGSVVSRDLTAPGADAALLCQGRQNAILYTLGPAAEGAEAALALLDQPAAGADYNLLPASFRRPDYLKKALIGLVAVNLLLLLLLGGAKGLVLSRQAGALDAQIEATRLAAEQAVALKSAITKQKKQLDAYQAMGTNVNLIALLADFSKNLPASASLDQLRFDGKTRTVTLQGYTDDLPGLTEKIADLGAATLKSTMKRRNQTYFHLEVSMP